MRVLILGSEGYIGRALKRYLDESGYTTIGVDNDLREHMVCEVGGQSVYPIEGRETDSFFFSIFDYERLKRVFEDFQPDVIVHLAEQPSAPYSHRDNDSCVRTLINNTTGTMNVLWAMKEVKPDSYLIKLGTAGEYPDWLYPDMVIPEGSRLTVQYNGDDWEIPTPRHFGSWYHSTKFYDSYMLDYANRIWGLNSVDINQSPVYGHLYDTRIDVDECFGTVVNRFAAQAVTGHPLTVYGREGGQTRGFIHLTNSIEAIEYYIRNQEPGYKVVHQKAEEKTIGEIAELFRQIKGCRVRYMDNPRAEQDSNRFKYSNNTLNNSDIHLIKMENVIPELLELFEEYQHRISEDMFPKIEW